MKNKQGGRITTIFSDIGGVLLTNGWDNSSRKKAAEVFGYDYNETDSRHRLMFDDYEIGKISLDEYLKYTIFNVPREFTRDEYKSFMYSQSQPLEGMLSLIKEMREKYDVKVVAVSNEGRDLTDYRINTFALKDYIDIFIVSCFAGMKKPDKGLFHLALDVSQAAPETVVYIDDRELFVEIGRDLGILSIHHTDLPTTKRLLNELLSKA